ncbi:MAG TPA: ATP-binding protein [Kofleriaceae bacterium]|nr:ATP-binding protein [Kofleriaceae bacterium]
MADFDSEAPTRAQTEVMPLADAWDGDTNPPVTGGLQLVCVAGSDLGRTFAVVGDSVSIGRGAVDIALHGNDVSRNHARIVQTETGFELEDLGSSNGTCINGKRITGAAALALGDRVQIGSTILVFQRHDELEERMRMLQRLEAMGTMAGGLAHDFNNALTVILGNLDHLRGQLPKDAELFAIVDEMKDAASSAAELAGRLLRLGRSEPQSHAVVRLAGLVDRAIATMRRQPGPKLAISAQIASDITVLGSYEELHQVLINLYLNARDAMPDGGVFRIGARRLSLDAQHAHARQLPGAGDYVELSASDTGVGMDKEVVARIFEPFYTTKPAGKGTGLGLAMVHGIVRRHGGSIDVESIPRSGTTFRIVLPAAQ